MNKADVEFYHSDAVLAVAAVLASKPYGQLSFRSKQRLLDKAVKVIQVLLSKPDSLLKLQKQVDT